MSSNDIHIELLVQVCTKFTVHPVVIFAQAFHYAESRHTKKYMMDYIRECCLEEEDGLRLMAIPEFVSDYCIDLMSGRCKPLMCRKLIIGKVKGL